jgi:hypothetical protein
MSTDTRLDEAARLRDEGMQQAEDHADPRLKIMIDNAIADANASGREWSANDIRDRLPVVCSGLVGARVKAASMRKPVEMVAVGEVQSNLPTTKTKRITVWRGVTS